MQIVPLSDSHIEPAARLFTSARRQAQALVPTLPCPHNAVETIAAKLTDLLKSFPGVGVVRDGTLCGYLIGFALPEFMSDQRGIYCPEWAHGAAGEQRSEMYRQCYARLFPQWAENGCYTHAITLFAQDAEALDVWFRNGFGLNGVDAVRDLAPLDVAVSSELEIRRAEPDDADKLLPLVHELHRHIAEGPVFVPLLELDGGEDIRTWLEQPSHALWFAQQGRHVIGYMQCQTAENEQRYVVSGADGIAISGAYTVPAWRDCGIAARLLNQMLIWAREQGLTRCSVDFKSQNIEANRFWLHHFTPVCYSLLRRLDERIARVNRKRSAETFW